MSVIVSAPASIKIGGVTVGTTLGETVITPNRSYEALKRPDSPHPFRYVKKNITFDIVIPISAHTAANIARAWDIPVGEFEVWNYENYNVTNLYNLEIVAGGITYRFAKVISIGTPSINYGHDRPTVISLTLRAILENEGTVAKLGGNNLPGQFNYRIQQIKRTTTKETYGGLQRYVASEIYDKFINWGCINMTLAQINLLESIYETEMGEITFTGIHGETFDVYFDEMNAPEEEDGYWGTSGTLRIKPD